MLMNELLSLLKTAPTNPYYSTKCIKILTKHQQQLSYEQNNKTKNKNQTKLIVHISKKISDRLICIVDNEWKYFFGNFYCSIYTYIS